MTSIASKNFETILNVSEILTVISLNDIECCTLICIFVFPGILELSVPSVHERFMRLTGSDEPGIKCIIWRALRVTPVNGSCQRAKNLLCMRAGYCARPISMNAWMVGMGQMTVGGSLICSSNYNFTLATLISQ